MTPHLPAGSVVEFAPPPISGDRLAEGGNRHLAEVIPELDERDLPYFREPVGRAELHGERELPRRHFARRNVFLHVADHEAGQLAEVREVGEAMAAQLGRVADEFIGAMSLVTEHLRPVLPPSTLGAPLDSRPLATTTNESSTLLRHQHGLTQLAERVNQGVRMANTAVSEARALASRLEAAQLAAGTGAGGQQQQETDERYLQSQMHLAHARQLEADARLHHSAASETFEQHLQKLVAEQVKSTLASERVLEARRRGMSRSHNWRARTYDTATVHAAATRLQAAHRGRSSRKKTKFLIAMRMTRQPGGLNIETPSLPALMRRRMLEQEAAHMELFAQRRLTQALQVGQVMKANQPKKAPAGAGNQGSKRPARK